ncbi:hypothetical protein TWF696_008847 [Orbilia brochopaga]|uniref:CHAT domain-containing protein n=1 Tax=Orbilia brochopaga TaxID=3140254 RepID=A0AAV9UED0_9PEZI
MMSSSASLQMSTLIPDTTQHQPHYTVKLVASKLAKDSWPSWYKPDTGSDDPYSNKWRYQLEYQGQKSNFGVIRDPFADTANAEEDLRWLLEDHAVEQPYWLKKAHGINKRIREYGKTLYNQIRRQLEDVVLGDSGLQRPGDILQGTPICLLVAGENGDNSIHALHWEALELQSDLDINVVRSIYPLNAQSEMTGENTASADKMAIDIVGEADQMDVDIDGSNDGAPLADQPNADGDYDMSVVPNLPEAKIAGEASTLRILFCTARSASIPNADIEYCIIARTVHNALSSLIKSRHIQMDFVRPGTWEALQYTLNSKPPGYYHLVHFDVHGKVTKKRAFIKLVSQEDPTELKRRDAVELAQLLSERKVSLVILNACESAKSASDLESNLAAVLVQNGVKFAIGMSFKLLVSSASTLVPLLYEQILQNRGAVALAVHKTRRALSRDSKRQGILGSTVSLPDAILPVLYQRADELETSLWPNLFPVSETPGLAKAATFPSTLGSEDSHIIGRDLDLLRVENALAAESHVVELVGVPGSGRTSFLQFAGSWWESTGLVDEIVRLGEEDLPDEDELRDEQDGLDDEASDPATPSNSFIDEIRRQIQLKSKNSHQSDSPPNTDTLVSPRRRGLLVLDDISGALVALTADSKKALYDILHGQEYFYVALVTDIRNGCTIGALPVHLLPLSTSIAKELLWNILPEEARGPTQTTDHKWHLDICSWILDYNPAAMKLLFGHLETSVSDTSNLSGMLYRIFTTGFPESNSATYIRFLGHPFVERIVALFKEFAGESEIAGFLFLCVGCSMLRIREDPRNLIKAFLLSPLLPDLLKPLELDPTIATVAADMVPQLQELYIMRKYVDVYRLCRDEFHMIISRLGSEGLIWKSVEGYYQVHPLLRTSVLTIALMQYGPEMMHEIANVFQVQYRLMSKYWEIGDLLALWSAESLRSIPRDSPRHVLSTDLANCIVVLHKPLFTRMDSSTEWLRNFPWMLFLHAIIYLCASVDSRSTQSTDTFVETLAPLFLENWNQSKSQWLEALEQDPKPDKYSFIDPDSGSTPDVWIGPVTAALVALLRLKRYLSTPSITTILAGEANDLYNEVIASASELKFDDYPMMVELLRAKYYIMGFNTANAVNKLDYLDAQYRRMHDNLNKHFSPGVSSKIGGAHDAGFVKGLEKICRKMHVSGRELVKGFPTLPEYSAWALERGLELNIQEDFKPILPLELDGVDFGADAAETPLSNQTGLMSMFPRSEGEEPGQSGAGADFLQKNDMVYWLIVYAHQSMRSSKMEEAATAFRKARMHLATAQPEIFDKSQAMTVARSHAFPHFYLESTVLWSLGRRKEGREILVQMRDICSAQLKCTLHRRELWDKYRAMDLLFDEFGPWKSAEGPPNLERIGWAIEFISSHFEPPEQAENDISSFLQDDQQSDRHLQPRRAQIAKGDPSMRVEHRIFSFLFGQYSRGLVSTYSSLMDRTSREFMKTVFDRIEEMVGVKKVDVAKLVEKVTSLHDPTRSYWQEEGKVSSHLAEIYVEAAKVLFGNLEDCQDLVHLTEYEGKPLRRFFPWEKVEADAVDGALEPPEFSFNSFASNQEGTFNFNRPTEEKDKTSLRFGSTQDQDKMETSTQPLFASPATTSPTPKTTWTQSSLKARSDRSKRPVRRGR